MIQRMLNVGLEYRQDVHEKKLRKGHLAEKGQVTCSHVRVMRTQKKRETHAHMRTPQYLLLTFHSIA